MRSARTGELIGVDQFDLRGKALRAASRAESALFDDEEGFWRLSNVRSTRIGEDRAVVDAQDEAAPWLSDVDPRLLAAGALVDPRKLSIADLRLQIRRMEREGLSADTYRIAFWGKTLQPLATPRSGSSGGRPRGRTPAGSRHGGAPVGGCGGRAALQVPAGSACAGDRGIRHSPVACGAGVDHVVLGRGLGVGQAGRLKEPLPVRGGSRQRRVVLVEGLSFTSQREHTNSGCVRYPHPGTFQRVQVGGDAFDQPLMFRFEEHA